MNFFFNNEKEKTKEKGKQIQKQSQKTPKLFFFRIKKKLL